MDVEAAIGADRERGGRLATVGQALELRQEGEPVTATMTRAIGCPERFTTVTLFRVTYPIQVAPPASAKIARTAITRRVVRRNRGSRMGGASIGSVVG